MTNEHSPELDTTLDPWLEQTMEVIEEISPVIFGALPIKVHQAEVPTENYLGSSIQLEIDDAVVEIGFFAEENVCRQLASALLGMDAEMLEEFGLDLQDALGEVCNILAGGLKGRLHHHHEHFQLGIPTGLDMASFLHDPPRIANLELTLEDSSAAHFTLRLPVN